MAYREERINEFFNSRGLMIVMGLVYVVVSYFAFASGRFNASIASGNGVFFNDIDRLLGHPLASYGLNTACVLAIITLTVLLIIVSISTLGVNTTSLAALLAAGGMAIGMALSGTVQNFAGGIMILAFKPFKSGDFIEAQGYMGTVNTVSIVSTTLTTPDNREIVIPNGALFNGSIDNYSRSGLRRVEWLVNVEYGTDSDKCKEQLLKIMKSDERILDASEKGAADPVVMLKSMESSSVVFTARGWVKADDYWDVFFQVNEEIYKKLPESGISFPFPQLDVRVKNMDS